jgi:UDP-2,3-diacylglucosamine hydrolase
MMPNQGEKIFLVSDAHLGYDVPSAEEIKRKKLIEFFDHVQEEGDRLIILGDLFDFWFEYRWMIDVSQFPVLAGLWQIRKSGIRIDYYLGNHDYWTSGFLSREIVTHVRKSPCNDNFGSKNAFLSHGDGLTGDEKGYLFMKRILRHPVSYSLFRFLHPDIGAWIARKTSKTSRKRIEQKREKSSAILREFARKKLEAGEYDWIIAGHSHQPEKTSFGNGIYLNIGDWSEHFTYGLIDGEEIYLNKWDR